MELKNAIAVCLITLFSATLVLLIARSLDLQAASRLEPQLARIVEELEAIRKSGRMATMSGSGAKTASADDCLMVYYLHGNTRCPTCRAIESQSHKTVESEFAEQVDTEEIVWKILNYEEPAGEALGKKFEVIQPVVVLAKMKGGQIDDWKRLDEVWALVGDKTGFAQYIRDEIGQMLATTGQQTAEVTEGDSAEIPVPTIDLGDLPIPETSGEPTTPPMQGEIAAIPQSVPEGQLPADGLMVYYFHGNTRCPTCRTIELQSYETVQASFPSQLESGQVLWQTLNYEEPTVVEVAKQFEIQTPGVVLATIKAGRIDAWRSLDDVWTLVDDKPAFAEYVRNEISEMLAGASEQPVPVPASTAPEISVRDVGPRDVPAPATTEDTSQPR